nr:hypothetical protein [uncultured Rhodopila sp.]
MTRLEQFIAFSALLTGEEAVALSGTGVAAELLAALDEITGAALTDELLARFAALPAGMQAEQAAGDSIMADPRLGPVARNVILLWLTGSWTQLPDAWRDSFGASPSDRNHVISAQSYQAGLQWTIAGAHPSGALQQGYGAWAMAPGSTAP